MLTRILRGRSFTSTALVLSLIALGLVSVEAKAETANYEVYEDEAAFYAALNPDTITVVDFDYYPDGTPVPTGYDPAGNWSGFEIMGDPFQFGGRRRIPDPGRAVHATAENHLAFGREHMPPYGTGVATKLAQFFSGLGLPQTHRTILAAGH